MEFNTTKMVDWCFDNHRGEFLLLHHFSIVFTDLFVTAKAGPLEIEV